MEKVRVVLMDDHEMFAESLRGVLSDRDGIDVVGVALDGEQVVKLVRQHEPDVLVLDYTMKRGGLDGPAVMARLDELGLACPVVFLSMHENLYYALQARDAGALGYVVKARPLSELVTAVQEVHAGREFVSEPLRQQLAERGPEPPKTGIDSLSPREFELLRHLGAGLALHEAARRMGVGESTASTYRSRMMAKLGLKTTHETIRFAIEHGIVG